MKQIIYNKLDFPTGINAGILLSNLLINHGKNFNLSTSDDYVILAIDTVDDEVAIRNTCLAHFAIDWKTKTVQEAVRLAAVEDSIKQDAVIASIKAMTNAEYDAWWAANVTTAAQAIGVLKRVVRILCRRVL